MNNSDKSGLIAVIVVMAVMFIIIGVVGGCSESRSTSSSYRQFVI